MLKLGVTDIHKINTKSHQVYQPILNLSILITEFNQRICVRVHTQQSHRKSEKTTKKELIQRSANV